MAASADVVLVVGAPNSSNSRRLVEVAERAGCRGAMLVQRAADIDWSMLENVRRVGITAGASAPEILVEEVIDALRQRYDVTVEPVAVTSEDVYFKLPRVLSEPAPA